MIPKHGKQILDEINKLDFNPSPFEKKFLKSIAFWILENRLLTDKQAETLNNIYVKASGGGDYQKKEII